METNGQHHIMATLFPRERAPGTHWIAGWVGLRACLDTEARGKTICLCRGSNPSRSVSSQTLYWLSYPSSTDLKIYSNNQAAPDVVPLGPRFQNCVGHAPLGGAVGPLGGKARVVCMRDIFILNKIWIQNKIYILVGTFLAWKL
jgi:hypothetical protein